MKYIHHPVDFYLTDNPAPDGIEQAINAAVSKRLSAAFASDFTYATLPVQWDFGENPGDGEGGFPVKDPLTVYVKIAMTDAYPEAEPPTYGFSIKDCVDEMLDYCGYDGKFAEEHVPSAMRLATALKELATYIEEHFPASATA